MSSDGFHPPRIDFVAVPDLARVADIVQPLDRDALHDILSLPGESTDLWRGLAAALPTATIPAQSLVSVVTPALSASVLDWSQFTKMVESPLAPARRRRRLWWSR